MFYGMIALFLLSAAPTEASVQALPGEHSRSIELRQATQDYLAALETQDEESIASAAERLVPELTFALESVQGVSEESRIALTTVRAMALWSLGRIEAADRDFFALDPAIARDAGYLDFRFDLALEQNDPSTILPVIEKDASAADPPEAALIHEFHFQGMVNLHRRLAEMDGAQARLAELILATDFDAHAPPGDRDIYHLWALRARLERGDIEGAREALGDIQTPRFLVDLLILNKYRALWPEIERRHGADLRQAVESYDRTLQETKAERLDEARFRVVYGNHLKAVGRYEDIVAELAPLADDWERMLADGEEGHWLVNIVADAEMATGRTASAIARMTRLAQIESASEAEAQTLISMRINRLWMLLRDRQFARALADATALAADPGGASPYGEMFIWSAAACAALELGNEAEVARWRDRVLAAPETNRPATLRVYLCADDHDAAEQFVIEWLRSDAPEGILGQFQNYAAEQDSSLWSPGLGDQLDAIGQRPAVRAEIEKVGRTLTLALAE